MPDILPLSLTHLSPFFLSPCCHIPVDFFVGLMFVIFPSYETRTKTKEESDEAANDNGVR